MSATTGQKALVIGAFAWGAMRDDEKRAAFEKGVLLAVAPHQWENMMREQNIATQAKDNLREELRVANLKLSDLDERLRNEQIAHMQQAEALRHELSKARDEGARLTRVMHAMIDGMSGPRAQREHTLPDGRSFTLDKATGRFHQTA